MQFGFVSAIFPELSFNEILSVASREGFDTVEIMCWPVGAADRKYAGVTHIDANNLTQTKAEDIRAECQAHKVGISGLGYYPNTLDPDPKVSQVAVDHFKTVIAAAALLGLTNVNGFVGRDWTKTVDENWPRFLEVWKPIVRCAEEHNVRIGIENCPMLFTRDEWPGGKNLLSSPAIWRRAFADIPSPCFGLNYDPSHLILQDIDSCAPLLEFKDKLFHLHAKDVKIDRAALNEYGRFDFPLRWHQPCIPGSGSIDWTLFFSTLASSGYAGPVCIEVEDDTFGKSFAGRLQALQAARTVLAPFFV